MIDFEIQPGQCAVFECYKQGLVEVSFRATTLVDGYIVDQAGVAALRGGTEPTSVLWSVKSVGGAYAYPERSAPRWFLVIRNTTQSAVRGWHRVMQVSRRGHERHLDPMSIGEVWGKQAQA